MQYYAIHCSPMHVSCMYVRNEFNDEKVAHQRPDVIFIGKGFLHTFLKNAEKRLVIARCAAAQRERLGRDEV